MFQENDVVELVEDAMYYLDGPSAAPIAIVAGTRGKVLKVEDQPQLTFEAIGVKFEDIETPIVFIRHGALMDTLSKIKKV